MGGIYKEQLISLNYGPWVYADGEWTYPTGSVGAQFITDVPFMTNSSARSTFLSKTFDEYNITNRITFDNYRYFQFRIELKGKNSSIKINHIDLEVV